MATETLPHGPQAFAGHDSSVFMTWVRALSDMMLTAGNPHLMAEQTLANYGGLMHALTEAAEELQAKERAEFSARNKA